MFSSDHRIDRMTVMSAAMCGGLQDFVYSYTAEGAIYWSITPSFTYGAGSTSETAKVLSAVRLATVAQIADGDFHSRMLLMGSGYAMQQTSIPDMRANVVQTILGLADIAPCEDAVGIIEAPDLKLGNASVTSCPYMTHYLCVSSEKARLLCPVTCGCHNPLSGLPRYDSEFGCPEKACRKKFEGHLAEIPCADPSLDHLQNTSWPALWADLGQHGPNFGPSFSALLSQQVQPLLTEGCDGMRKVNLLGPQTTAFFCTYFFRPWCPEQCGCSNHHYYHQDCPMTCCPDDGRNCSALALVDAYGHYVPQN
jgi:hypothetical protein